MANQLKPLQRIFTDRLFRVPDYQRGYSWGESQLEDFWHDLMHIPSGRKHYTGVLTLEPVLPIVFESWQEDRWLIEKSGFQPYYLVDGQQRLTSAVILIKCILNKLAPGGELNFVKKEDLEGRYIRRTGGVNQSYIFGYEKDNPSYEFLKTRIFNGRSLSNQGIETLYTANLEAAKEFFETHLEELNEADLPEIFTHLTQDLLFNEYEISDDLDVFVAFETMNNRGKPLSKLELLKNRLIYLSTLVKAPDSERQTLRANINEAWKTIYEYLGAEKARPLDDDDFLRNHWAIYFVYSRDQADQFSHVLLNEVFTAPRATSGKVTATEIQKYVESIQESARQWHCLHFPERNPSLNDEIRFGLERLCRLGHGAFRPIILAALVKRAPSGALRNLLAEGERFVFLVSRAAKRRADAGDAHFYRRAHDYYAGDATLEELTSEIKERADTLFLPDYFRLAMKELFDDGAGFYEWNGLRYFLFEYEQNLQAKARSATTKLNWDEFTRSKRDHVTVEHIYPQDGSRQCWRDKFGKFSARERHRLCQSVGNLLALAHHKNVSLSNECFEEKKKPTSGGSGYFNGSYSEIEVAQEAEWTAESIFVRGLRMLGFFERRWRISLGDNDFKKELLGFDSIQI